MRNLLLASAIVFSFPLDAIASCKLEREMMNQSKMDAKLVEVRINSANYEEGKAGNEKCRLLRKYIYLRDRYNHFSEKLMSCSNELVAENAELRMHSQELKKINDLYVRRCYGEKSN